ncbi:hypothetical protein Q3G72_020573 [Acer saccharum]|nr:hypothetical protein Q3G72_020573 [Acer saccharum]
MPNPAQVLKLQMEGMAKRRAAATVKRKASKKASKDKLIVPVNEYITSLIQLFHQPISSPATRSPVSKFCRAVVLSVVVTTRSLHAFNTSDGIDEQGGGGRIGGVIAEERE